MSTSRCSGHPRGRTWTVRHWLTCRLARIPMWNVRLGRWSRALAPAYGVCRQCETPWRFVQPRIVNYGDGRGQFALCVKCWDESTVDERLHAHRVVTLMWDDAPTVLPDVEAAVLATTRYPETA